MFYVSIIFEVKMRINPIQNTFFKSNWQASVPIQKTRAENYNDYNYVAESNWVAKATINPIIGKMAIDAEVPNAMDAKVTYLINSDGSGEIFSCWSPRSTKYQQGTFSDVYNEASKMCKDKRTDLSEKQSDKLLDLAGKYATSDNEV